jgi:hemoglobin/transferrin/lactoferrin receptor protein
MKQILSLATTALCGLSSAQPVIPDSSKHVVLDEVLVSPGKTEERKSETPYEVEIISARRVELLAPVTSADMLMNTGSVFVQKSQGGGGSPVLRGFEASRVLIVIDGVRMNNAIYRTGHLQDVITIDPLMLDRTEVIFGPSSVVYGSDALGGVMHFYTKKPQFGTDNLRVRANASAGWTSGNTALSAHGNVNFGGRKLASLTSMSYNKFGDVRAGSVLDPAYDSVFLREFYAVRIDDKDSMVPNPDPLVQTPSGYSQYDVMQKLTFRQDDRITHTLSLQASNSSNIPRYDRLTEMHGGTLRFAEWYYGPQKRLMGSLTSVVKSHGKLFNKAALVLAAQAIGQERVNRTFGNPNRVAQMEDVTVLSVNTDFIKVIGERHELRYGLDAQHNLVKSEAVSTDITTGAESPAVTRYPDGGSTMTTFGAYLGHRFRHSDKLLISEGIRFSFASIQATFRDTTFFAFPFTEVNQKHPALTGNVGLVLHPIHTWKISAVLSSGFRSPNVDDLTKIFDSSPGTLIVANPDVKPEMAYNAEMGIEKTWQGSVRLSGSGWITKVRNAMVVQNFTYAGQDSLLYQGVMSQVQAVQNVNGATIVGATGTFAADLNAHFSFLSSATFTQGTYYDAVGDTTVPLDHIPPAFGRTALIFTSDKFDAECYVMYNGWKRVEDYSPSGEDNLQYATPYGMPSWTTVNLKAALQATQNLRIQAGVENILDVHYRHFASGISAPGRNFNVMLRVSV